MADSGRSVQGESIWGGGAIEELDLDSHSVLRHFAADGGPDATRNLSFLLGLDSVDRWAVDFREHARVDVDALQLRAFIGDLERVMREHVGVLDRVIEPLIKLLAGITTSRCMVILRYLSQKNERFIEQLALALESQDTNDLMVITVRQRLVAFEQAELLGRIFSGARLMRIKQIMGSYRDVV